MTSSLSGIHCDALGFAYGATPVLHGIDLHVPTGQIVGILGPNGAGKTTTLKILVGLLRPGSGRVTIDGHDLAVAQDAAKRATAYVPDKPHLYERLTGWEYLEFVAGLWGVNGSSGWEETAGSELKRFGILDAQDQLVESYSLGMRQKLLFVAGIIHTPRVWILDEPMSGLDPRACLLMRDLLKREADRGAAILLSTHTLPMAEKVCDRIVIIDHGRKIAEGSVDELHALVRGRGTAAADLEALFIELTQAPEAEE